MPETATRTHSATCRCRQLVGGKQIRGQLVGTQLLPGGRPLTIATFAAGELVDITLQHWAGRDRCPIPAEQIDPDTWRRT